MASRYCINVDLADVWADKSRKKILRTLGWGDEVSVVSISKAAIEIEAVVYRQEPDGSVTSTKTPGFIVPTAASGLKTSDIVRKAADNDVLRVNFVDVQQGDGAVIETPDGKVILVDGGDNQMFARYLAGRFRGTSESRPKDIDCIVVTHGDADHFEGLPLIYASETHANPKKRLFIRPHRVYHNGIVKRPSTVPEKERLGKTRQTPQGLYVTGLETNLLQVPDAEMNAPFLQWKEALKAYNKRKKIEFRRLEIGDEKAFDFIATGDLNMEVLGPLTETVGGKPALRFLGKPPKGPRVGHESLAPEPLDAKGFSASHTINGHSVVLKLNYGGFSFLFSGDLNDEASRFLAREHNKGRINLRSEVFKVPHHGSADFSGAFLQAVSPVVSVVSSGDESARKEYIHPRATLIGALGKHSRIEEPLVFVTELVAFFTYEGVVQKADPAAASRRGEFHGFSRAAFGMVKTRTNGARLLVYTDSANVSMKEAYAYAIDDAGQPQPAPVARA